MSFARNGGGDHKDSFSHYHVRNVEIKDFNVLIDGRRIFDLPVKNEGAYEKLLSRAQNWQFIHNWQFIQTCLFQKKIAD